MLKTSLHSRRPRSLLSCLVGLSILFGNGCGSVAPVTLEGKFSTEISSSSPLEIYRRFPVVLSFDRDISDLALSDILVLGGQAADLEAINASTYRFWVVPDGASAIEVSLVLGSVVDADGSPNKASEVLTRTYVSPASAYQRAVLAEADLAGYWTLDETWTDLVLGLWGTAIGNAAFATAKIGTKAGVFDGNGDCLAFESLPIKGGSGPISMEAWVKIAGDNVASNPKMITGLGQTSMDGTHLGMGFEHGSDNHLYIAHHGPTDWATGIAVSSGVWHHIAYTFDGTTEKVYVDGVVAGSRTGSFELAPQPSFQIGSWDDQWGGGPASYPFNGSIDDVAIYEGTLSAATILTHYAAAAAE